MSIVGSFRHVIVGGGIVGLSIGASLSKHGSTLIIEKNKRTCMETSSRNSEVIHSGIYYPKDSLKSSLCIKGRRFLYNFCEANGIPYCKTGKWIVSQSDLESEVLFEIKKRADDLQVPLRFLSTKEIQSGEPLVDCIECLESAETGIVDSHSLKEGFEHHFSSNSGDIALNTKVIDVTPRTEGGYEILAVSNGEQFRVIGESLINSAGLHSDKIARIALSKTASSSSSSSSVGSAYDLKFCKGHYFKYVGKGRDKKWPRSLVSRLVYPCPLKNVEGLGVHATIDLSGGMRFGPDTLWLEDKNQLDHRDFDYSVPEDLCSTFRKAASKYLPCLADDSIPDSELLAPDYSGIRPKLSAPGEPARDFIIQDEASKGLPHFINCIGIESPGLTSSIAIAYQVHDLLGYGPNDFPYH